MKKIKLLFQGDSITDAGRDRADIHNLGSGYPKYAAELIREAYPDVEFEFIDLGIGGNRTDQLFDRMYTDMIELAPDVISILIGINDVWHRHSHKIETTDAQVKANYSAILARIKAQTNAKVLALSPFLLDSADKEAWRSEVDSVTEIIKSYAEQYADAYLPLNEHFEEALKTQPEACYYSPDGVHPNENGARFIAALYLETVKPLIDELL